MPSCFVNFERPAHGSFVVTEVTLVGLLSCMPTLVPVEAGLVRRHVAAEAALIRLLCCVHSPVDGQAALPHGCVRATVALVLPFSRASSRGA